MSIFNDTLSRSTVPTQGENIRFSDSNFISRSRDFEKHLHDFEHFLATHDTISETPHSLFSPMHYEPGYSYPLMIWLHGESTVAERQLMKIMPIVSMRNYVAIAPRGIDLHQTGQMVSGNLQTGQSETPHFGWPNTEDGFHSAQKRVFDCLRIASEKCHISKRRVFLAGFDDGGTMAFQVAMQFPQYFAGGISLGGAFPLGRMPLRQLDAVRQLPCLMCVGRDSQVFPPSEAAKQMTLFHTAGMSVTVRQYPCRQEISIQMLNDVNRWMMERISEQKQVSNRSFTIPTS